MAYHFKEMGKRLMAALALMGVAALADAGLVIGAEIRVKPETSPKPIVTADGQVDNVIEPSGAEPIGDGSKLLVVHDKAPALVVVETKTGRELGDRLMCSEFPTGLKAGPKWEGLGSTTRAGIT